MSRVTVGRTTHRHEGELVVFHIGMTINQWWRPDLWMPLFADMPRMLRELSTDPESGMLGSHMLLGASGPYLVQYWSSIDKLYDYASSAEQHHRPAWARFNQRARSAPRAVGVWHETFLVDRAESIYISTPPMGLPAATTSVPVTSRHDRARARFADGRTTGSPETDSRPAASPETPAS
ncbi:DUF4188 domain-containing protein [Sanguibacter inulinus]|uniref:DUF4188 domain-containing protein n=1 Tax=Sanguibacter inulinus TaxID=60922 RepID=A0A853ETY0_9MICO|nr:DUF4188 domain-containing protein [Sanguibacter inulinus]MBF0722816.1 DUF4188 domain-containing protein [Sanguibacter inulinus]NYS93961.1 DUF4188 domain-containing protein [Sanguibacter inulinus]